MAVTVVIFGRADERCCAEPSRRREHAEAHRAQPADLKTSLVDGCPPSFAQALVQGWCHSKAFPSPQQKHGARP